jgi:hypothetical protein
VLPLDWKTRPDCVADGGERETHAGLPCIVTEKSEQKTCDEPLRIDSSAGHEHGRRLEGGTRLPEKGLAQRLRADDRSREQSLALTASGRTLIPKLAGRADANDEHLFSHPSADAHQSLMEIMQALVKHHQLK